MSSTNSLHSNVWTEDFKTRSPLELLEILPKDEQHWHSVQTASLGAIRALGLMDKKFPDERLVQMNLDSLLTGRLALYKAKECESDPKLLKELNERLHTSTDLNLYDSVSPRYPRHEGKWSMDIHEDLLAQAFFKNNGQPNLSGFNRLDKFELIRVSEIWVAQLTPFQQYSIGWLLRGGDKVLFQRIYDYLNLESLNNKINDQAFETLTESIKSSIAKAPQLSKSIKAYRSAKLKMNEEYDLRDVYKVGEKQSFKAASIASLNPQCAVANIDHELDAIFIYEMNTLASAAVLDETGINGTKVIVPAGEYVLESVNEHVHIINEKSPINIYRWKEV